ncbi:MAG: hypothetical protein ACRENT_01020 [Thermodesulfobacteriota bacterium]
MESEAANNLKTIETKIQELLSNLHAISGKDISLSNAKDAEELEKSVRAITSALADQITAKRFQQWLMLRSLAERIRRLAQRDNQRFTHKDNRKVDVRFSGGSMIPLVASYWIEHREEGPTGVFLSLYLLGVHDHCSPLLVAEIPKLCAALGSLKEAQGLLADRACRVDIKTIRNVMKRFAKRARLCQKMQSHLMFSGEKLSGCRAVLSADGGRVRIRKNKRGKRTRKGRSRYSTDWREPKLLIIYVVNEEGRMSSAFAPVIDGSLGGPESLYALIWIYLHSLGISQVEQILFVADGAPWIWECLQALRSLLQIQGIHCRIVELIDMYHAVQHLHAFAALKRGWGRKKRTRWINTQKGRLRHGKIEAVLEAFRHACSGTRSKALLRERGYFVKNRERLDYAAMRALNMPIGSGAIESAIRRVINLRMKSPCVFWNEDTAEEMLLLRSYYKAGRWESLKVAAYEGGIACAA